MLMLKKYCGDVTIWTPPSPHYVTISHHFGVAPPPPPPWRRFSTTPISFWGICSETWILPGTIKVRNRFPRAQIFLFLKGSPTVFSFEYGLSLPIWPVTFGFRPKSQWIYSKIFFSVEAGMSLFTFHSCFYIIITWLDCSFHYTKNAKERVKLYQMWTSIIKTYWKLNVFDIINLLPRFIELVPFQRPLIFTQSSELV